MGEAKEEQEKELQIIHVGVKDIGNTKFTFDPSKGEKIILVVEDASEDISM